MDGLSEDEREIIAKVAPGFDFESEPLARDALVITCRRVWEEGQPVRRVYHEEDGSFQFLCDGYEHESESQVVNVHSRHILERGPAQLEDFTYLRKGWGAEHLHDETWSIDPIPPEDGS